MLTEIEAKFLGIDRDELRKKLEQIGAELKQPDRLMRRKNYDYPDGRLDREYNGWVRVRDEGNKTTLAYKQLNDRTLHGTKEVNVTVSDFERTCQFLEAIGLQATAYQESRRESWMVNEVEIELDEWPWIPPFVELEAPDEESLKKVVSKLGLDWQEAVHGSVEVAYRALYDVTDEEIDHIERIPFSEVPEWLEKRRRA